MRGFNVIVGVALVCGLVNLVESSSYSELEEHLTKVGATGEDAIEKALDAIDNGQVGVLPVSTRNTLMFLNATFISCYENNLSELMEVASFKKELTFDHPLAKATNNAINRQVNACTGIWKSERHFYNETKTLPSVRIGGIVEEIAKIDDVCNGVDKNEPGWQYKCMSQIIYFDTDKFASAVMNGLKGFDSTEFDEILKKSLENTQGEVVARLFDLIYDVLGDGCGKIGDSEFNDVYNFNVLYNLVFLNTICTDGHLNYMELEALKRSAANGRLCDLVVDQTSTTTNYRKLAEAIAEIAY